jgi:hypothetical protein
LKKTPVLKWKKRYHCRIVQSDVFIEGKARLDHEFGHSYLAVDLIDSYIAELIVLAAAPFIAMVFIWSNLSNGEPNFKLSPTALNDVVMIFPFTPILVFFIWALIYFCPIGNPVFICVIVYSCSSFCCSSFTGVPVKKRLRTGVIKNDSKL